jgi:electron transfer flavoprotein beta subunit
MALRKIGDATLVICGKQASDGDTAQVGPGMATHLDMAQVTYVRKIEELDDNHIVAERLLESGYEVIESELPCMLTVVKEINEPRLPSLKGKMAARKAQITTWTASDIEADPEMLGLDGSPTKVVKIFTPERHADGEMLEGEPNEIVEQLVDKLKDVVLGVS